jgi:heterodisulfide reductase subunit C
MMAVEIIHSTELDAGFKFRIAAEEGGEGILKCYACGSCTVRCPEQKVKPEFNPR